MNGYINIELLASMLILLFAIGILSISFKNKKLLLRTVLLLYSLIISLSLYSSYSNFEYFKNGGELICTSNHIGGEDIYLVSIKEGWEIFDSFFKKDSLLIKTYQCEQR